MPKQLKQTNLLPAKTREFLMKEELASRARFEKRVSLLTTGLPSKLDANKSQRKELPTKRLAFPRACFDSVHAAPYLDGDPIPGRVTTGRRYGYEVAEPGNGELGLLCEVAGDDPRATPGCWHFWYEYAYLVLGLYTVPAVLRRPSTLDLTLSARVQMECFVLQLMGRRNLTDYDNWVIGLSLSFSVPSLTSNLGRGTSAQVFFTYRNGVYLDIPDPISTEMNLQMDAVPGGDYAVFVSASMQVGLFGDAPLVIACNASPLAVTPDADFGVPAYIRFPELRIQTCYGLDIGTGSTNAP